MGRHVARTNEPVIGTGRMLCVGLTAAALLAADPVEAGAQRASGSAAGAKVSAAAAEKETARLATQTVTVEQLRQTLLRYLHTWAGGKVTALHADVIQPQDPVILPAGPLDVRVTPRALDEGFGRRMFEVSMTVGDREIRTVRVLADVSAWADVVATVRSIKPDETLQAEDVTMTRVQLPGLEHDFVTDIHAAIGKRAIRPLQPNSPVQRSALALPYLVRRGDAVTIEVRHGGLLIQAAGTTKTAGQLGQSVLVTNRDSGKEVRGKVVGPGVVRVTF